MSSRTVKILALVVIVLVAAVVALNMQHNGSTHDNELLFPELKTGVNDITTVTITDADSAVTIEREDNGWIVPEKGGYAANTATLRQLLLAVAEARKIEQKTSNAELYERLGVADPTEAGGSGVLISGSGSGETDFSLILGNAAQQDYRYVRIPDEAESWLIDQNPDVPENSGGWLSQDIVTIDASRIKSVTIAHPDGETIAIHKDSEDDTNYEVADIPEGRELSYPSVVNSIASVLSKLTLEDVSSEVRSGDDNTVSTVFTTFDGLRIAVESTKVEDKTWIELEASVIDDTATAEAAKGEDGTNPLDAANPSASSESENEPTPKEEAAAINALVSGWSYRITDYKADQLTRRWADVLKAEEQVTPE